MSEIELKDAYIVGKLREIFATDEGDMLWINRHHAAALLSAIEERAPQWKPIESAPKDGTEIDLWHPKLGRITGSYWDAYMERWTILCDPEGPTHFMLPLAPPEVQG